MSFRFIHGVAWIRISLLLNTIYIYSIICIYHILFTHLSIDGYLGHLYIFTLVNNAAKDIPVKTYLYCFILVRMNEIINIEMLTKCEVLVIV